MEIRVGDRAKARGTLRPAGEVLIDGVVFPAKSDDWVQPGEAVIILGRDGFGLRVRSANSVTNPDGLPGSGEPIPSAAEVTRERERQEARGRAKFLGLFEGVDLFLVLVAVASPIVGYLVGGAVGCGIGCVVLLIAFLILALQSDLFGG